MMADFQHIVIPNQSPIDQSFYLRSLGIAGQKRARFARAVPFGIVLDEHADAVGVSSAIRE